MGKTERDGDDLDWGRMADLVQPRVRVLRNALMARSVPAVARFDLPSGSLTVLSLMAANPGRSQAALARHAGINTSALVGIVDQLEQRGLAERDRSAVDRRRNNLTVTEAGLAAIDALYTAVEQVEAPIHDALGRAEMAALISLLERANDALAAADSTGLDE